MAVVFRLGALHQLVAPMIADALNNVVLHQEIPRNQQSRPIKTNLSLKKRVSLLRFTDRLGLEQWSLG